MFRDSPQSSGHALPYTFERSKTHLPTPVGVTEKFTLHDNAGQKKHSRFTWLLC